MSSTKITKYDLDESVLDGIADENFVQEYSQQKHNVLTITLSESSWSNNSQTVTATGVTANNTVVISPTPESHSVFGKANVRCSA